MQHKIHGFRKLDFKSNDGNQVQGVQLFTTYQADGVTGEQTDKIFIRADMEIPSVKIGDLIEVFYNNRGKVDSIKAVKA